MRAMAEMSATDNAVARASSPTQLRSSRFSGSFSRMLASSDLLFGSFCPA
jgi:hypothetical protein